MGCQVNPRLDVKAIPNDIIRCWVGTQAAHRTRASMRVQQTQTNMASGKQHDCCSQLPDLALEVPGVQLEERNRMARLKEIPILKLQCLIYCLRHGY